jgi:large subunit ribosomal protein L22
MKKEEKTIKAGSASPRLKPGTRAGEKKERLDKKTPDGQKEPTSSKVASKKEEVSQFVVRGRFLRISPRKVRLVADLVKGMPLDEARIQLTFNPKRASAFLVKVLINAESIAAHNYKLDKKDLFIKNVLVNQGPTLHRFKPAARGAAHPIRKRSTHLEIVIAKKINNKDERPKFKNVSKKPDFFKKVKK